MILVSLIIVYLRSLVFVIVSHYFCCLKSISISSSHSLDPSTGVYYKFVYMWHFGRKTKIKTLKLKSYLTWYKHLFYLNNTLLSRSLKWLLFWLVSNRSVRRLYYTKSVLIARFEYVIFTNRHITHIILSWVENILR